MQYREDRKSDWNMGTSTTSRSFELESWNYVQHKDYQLNLLTKVGKQSKHRRPIPIVENERLSFYRGLCTSIYRIQIQYLQQLSYNRFFWIYVANVLLRSIPLNYIHVFLGDYCPDEHLFASKMVPLMVGASWQMVMATVMQLVMSADILALVTHYALVGILFNSPWDNCDKRIYDIPPYNARHKCYSIPEFYENFTTRYKYYAGEILSARGTKADPCEITFSYNFYRFCKRTGKHGEGFFTAGPLSYFLRFYSKTSIIRTGAYAFMVYFIFIWVASGCFYKEIYRKRCWKALNVFQLVCNIMYLVCTGYMFLYAVEKKTESYGFRSDTETVLAFGSGSDFDFLGESIGVPPIVQVLTSRSNDKPVTPGRDSFMITFSNLFMYFFKGLINYKLGMHVQSVAHAEILVSYFNPFPIFYLWPFLFHEIPLGSIFLKIFYVLIFITEFLIFMLTYQILIEIMACEWKWARRWKASLALSGLGFIMSVVCTHEVKRVLYLYTSAFASVIETIVVCWMYPLGRLSDDIYFQYGKVTNTYRLWSLRLLVLYTLYKTYQLYYITLTYVNSNSIFQRFVKNAINCDYSCVSWAWIPSLIPIFAGNVYAIYIYTIKHKQNWKTLFTPRPDYGPREHVTRQLRKQFDSRGYIASQTSRYLSRHLLAKSGTPTYRLDIRYDDLHGRRSTVVSTGFSIADNRN